MVAVEYACLDSQRFSQTEDMVPVDEVDETPSEHARQMASGVVRTLKQDNELTRWPVCFYHYDLLRTSSHQSSHTNATMLESTLAC